MKQFEISDPETVKAVSTDEIARNLARLMRIDYAVDAQRLTDRDEPQTAWMLAGPHQHVGLYEQYWARPADRLEAYDRLTIFCLEGRLSLKAIAGAVQATPAEHIDISAPPAHADQAAVRRGSEAIYAQACVEALGRVGLLTAGESGLAVPLGAQAALHYRRADIRQPVDRALYERAPEIDARAAQLSTAVPPLVGTVEVTVANADRTALEQQQRVWPAYASVETSDEWWQKLDYDLRRISDER